MSKGLGAVERAILEAISDGKQWTAFRLVSAVYAEAADGTPAQLAAVRRALLGLERKRGRVVPIGRDRRKRLIWMSPEGAEAREVEMARQAADDEVRSEALQRAFADRRASYLLAAAQLIVERPEFETTMFRGLQVDNYDWREIDAAVTTLRNPTAVAEGFGDALPPETA